MLSCSRATNSNRRTHIKPFSVVEAERFVNLLQYVAPNCTPMTRRMLMTRLDASYVEMKLRLKESLASVPYVVVTADCWTTFRRSYMGATVSWLEPTALTRKSAVLICRRMPGRKTYDKLASPLLETFQDYDLQGKVTKVVTDNGSNFVKAFKLFSEPQDAITDVEKDLSEVLDVTALLSDVTDGEARLPPHHRCSAHTLNLVATADASEAEKYDLFAGPLKSVLRSCRALWSKQGQSSVANETILRYCGRTLLRPVATRWNSFFDAFECILAIDSAGKDLDGLCRALQTLPFQRPQDLQFIKEYCEPLACAIDIVQKDENMYIGYLLPTISVLQRRLEHLQMSGLAFCTPLVNALLTGIHKSRPLADLETGIESLHKHELVRKVFVRYNTALPSSASVERVFSVAADVFTRKRGKMTPENFERQLLLKLIKL
ncbi:hypothetical protein HPB47_007416 [Ixodes persulcatus]|uniref:Uncharacterized protein n=1 Tax=Ixodes persulcatus TaxID=34615 RepID=A0AC60P7L4_IXOPE|nr:hypothetical protein HPB47_007416 [Ixodes persulcatus]